MKNYFEKLKKIFTFKLKKNKKISKFSRQNSNLQLSFNFKKKFFFVDKKIIFLFLLVLLVAFSFVLKWNYFRITKIDFIKNDPFIDTILLSKNLKYLYWKLIFKVDKEQIKNKLLKIEENIENLKIEIKHNYITIFVSSYKPIFQINLDKKDYLLTENWVIIPFVKLKNINYSKLDIKNFNVDNYFLYKKIFDKNKLNQINYILKSLKENIVNLKIKSIVYYVREREVHIVINNDTILIFDLNWDLKQKLKQLFVFNREKIDITKPGIFYLDNRILWKIYYCPAEEKNVCARNLNLIYN